VVPPSVNGGFIIDGICDGPVGPVTETSVLPIALNKILFTCTPEAKIPKYTPPAGSVKGVLPIKVFTLVEKVVEVGE